LVFLYNIFLLLYRSAIIISSAWNVKAKKWLAGRKNIFEKIQSELIKGANERGKTIWIHCSSLGEFEQGKPVIERIRDLQPSNKIVLTFFSPSGFEVKKNDPLAAYIFYLPFDSKRNAKRLLDLLHPSLVLLIKYDYWYHYLSEIKKRDIPCLLVSASFRKSQAFFKWHGVLQRKMLTWFTKIFVQNKESETLLHSIGINQCTVSGDTRFDTVIEIARNFKPIPKIEAFINNKKCIVAGSTWKQDEEFLKQIVDELRRHDLKLIIAPHEVHEAHLRQLKTLLPESLRYSELATGNRLEESNLLIVDNIGMLSRLYHYAFIAYIGGGFTGDGVHNVLEAAVYGKPLVFGSNFKKYKEAIDLVECEAAKSFSDKEELYQIMSTLLDDISEHQQKSIAAEKYVWENQGATQKIIRYIEENRLLTN